MSSRIAYLLSAEAAETVQVFPHGIFATNVAPGPSIHRRTGPFFAVRWIVVRPLVSPTRIFFGSVEDSTTSVRE